MHGAVGCRLGNSGGGPRRGLWQLKLGEVVCSRGRKRRKQAGRKGRVCMGSRGVLGVIFRGRLRLEAGLARKDMRHGMHGDFVNYMHVQDAMVTWETAD